jgi:hypothetical protein
MRRFSGKKWKVWERERNREVEYRQEENLHNGGNLIGPAESPRFTHSSGVLELVTSEHSSYDPNKIVFDGLYRGEPPYVRPRAVGSITVNAVGGVDTGRVSRYGQPVVHGVALPKEEEGGPIMIRHVRLRYGRFPAGGPGTNVNGDLSRFEWAVKGSKARTWGVSIDHSFHGDVSHIWGNTTWSPLHEAQKRHMNKYPNLRGTDLGLLGNLGFWRGPVNHIMQSGHLPGISLGRPRRGRPRCTGHLEHVALGCVDRRIETYYVNGVPQIVTPRIRLGKTVVITEERLRYGRFPAEGPGTAVYGDLSRFAWGDGTTAAWSWGLKNHSFHGEVTHVWGDVTSSALDRAHNLVGSVVGTEPRPGKLTHAYGDLSNWIGPIEHVRPAWFLDPFLVEAPQRETLVRLL